MSAPRPRAPSVGGRRPPCGRGAAAAASARMRRPSSVMRAVWHRARRGRRARARASASAAAGGGSSQASVCGSGTPHSAQVEQQGRQDRRRGSSGCGEGGQARAVSGFVPQPVADAGLGAPGAAAALVGGGARDADGLEARHADAGLEARHAREAAVDDDAHALDGERGLGDGGGQHHLARGRRRRRDGARPAPRGPWRHRAAR